MNKVTFSKLNLKKLNEVKTITIGDQEVEIKQYLPIEEKLNLIANVLNNSADDNNFSSPVKVDAYMGLEIVYAYTNIIFTDKQKEEAQKTYDLLEENDIINLIISNIPQIEYNTISEGVRDTIAEFYKYNNSVYGILDRIFADYNDLKLDVDAIHDGITNSGDVAFLKDVMEKLG